MDSNDSTGDLVARAQRGDNVAFSALLDRYYARVRSIARRNMRRLHPRHDSPDVTHESLVQAIRNSERFDMHNGGSLLNWMAKIVERTALAARICRVR